MFTNQEIKYLRSLYRKIFYESADNSKEFANFVAGHPNSLRIKVEETIARVNEDIMNAVSYQNRDALIKRYTIRRDLLKELDLFITNYIENHYV